MRGENAPSGPTHAEGLVERVDFCSGNYPNEPGVVYSEVSAQVCVRKAKECVCATTPSEQERRES